MTAAREHRAKGRVLVVEDDRASRTALVALLRLSGFEALPASNVTEGLSLLDQQPDCLILDLMLPDGNGGNILAHIRRSRMPMHVIVTTGAIEWEKMLSNSPGAPDKIFQKPVNFHELVEWLQEHC